MKVAKQFIPVSQPWLTKDELREVWDAMQSGWVTLGPKTHQFEEAIQKYTGAKFAIGTNSCAAALHLAVAALELKPGDEVIVPAFTFAASINPILYEGATPVMVDSDEATFNIDPVAAKNAITRKTKAIIIVHYGGYPAAMDELLALARKHNITIIEDAAHALGASYNGKKIGNIGDISCFSFHAIKNITTGDGGMVTTNNEKFADIMTKKRLQGMSKEAWKRATKAGSWYYEIDMLGYKYNMNDIQAAMGVVQLKKLDNFISRREEIAQLYDEAFADIEELITPVNGSKKIKHARNLYPLRLRLEKLKIDRDEFIEKMRDANIGSNVYFIPLYRQPLYAKLLKVKQREFPIAEMLYNSLIDLPMYPKMKNLQVRQVIATVKEIVTAAALV